MQGSKAAALAHLAAAKCKTKNKDEARRAEVTAKIQGRQQHRQLAALRDRAVARR